MFSDFKNLVENLDCKYFSEKSFCALKNSIDCNNFICLNMNIWSLPSKFDQFKSFLDNLSHNDVYPHAFTLQEIFQPQPQIHDISGYNFYFKARSKSRGGGIGTYLRKDLNAKVIDSEFAFIENVFESLPLLVETSLNKRFILLNFYRPPCNNQSSVEDFFYYLYRLLEKLDVYKLPIYVFTDSNFDLMKTGTNDNSTYFFDIMNSFGFCQLLSKCTRLTNLSNSLIDQIFTNQIATISKSGVIVDTFSDHMISFCFIKSSIHTKIKNDNFVFRRNFSEFKKDLFRQALAARTWNNVYTCLDPNEAYLAFFDEFKTLFDFHFPLIRVRVNINRTPLNKFMSKGLLISRNVKLKLARKAKASKLTGDVEKFKKYRNVYNTLVRKAKLLHYNREILKAGSDSKKMWKTINEACNRNCEQDKIEKIKVGNTVLSNETDIANAFGKFFSDIGANVIKEIPQSKTNFSQYLPPPARNSMFLEPTTEGEILMTILSMQKKNSCDINDISLNLIQSVAPQIVAPLNHIFNLSLENGVFPDGMKTSKTIPIFKKAGNKLDLNNYRGISIVNSFSKILEKLVSIRLLKFLEKTNFFSDNQFGFLKGRSTNQAVLQIINFVTKAINEGKYTLSIFLDIRKAFDSVNHEILFHKLKNAGIRGTTLSWFKSFLTGRNQRIKVGKSWSDDFYEIQMSVLQGSILGVILFLIFINDISNASELLASFLFADDISSLLAHSDLEELNRIANIELQKLANWYSANRLSIHPDKSKFMIFKSPHQKLNITKCFDTPYFPLYINFNDNNESDITKLKLLRYIPNSEETSIKVLGILLDQHLSLKDHVNYIHAKISRGIYNLRQLSKLLPSNILKLIYFANIHSHLSYCSNILTMCTMNTLQPLIVAQKKALRLVCGKGAFESTNPLFQRERILPLMDIIKLNSLIFMFNYTHGNLPPSFNNVWHRIDEVNDRYNLRNRSNFRLINVRYIYLDKHPLLSFPKLWNNLNNDLKLETNIINFVKSLKFNIFNSLS